MAAAAKHSRVLAKDVPRVKWSDDLKGIDNHSGQHKLLLVELEFLTRHAQNGDVVVYAGAAPGWHIPVLAELFPVVRFELWDPRPFVIKQTEQITLHNEEFTDDAAKHWNGKYVLFLSDVRESRDSKSTALQRIDDGMDAQRRWHSLIGSKKSLLKFQLPRPTWRQPDAKVEYLAGDLWLQPFMAAMSTECRLEPSGSETTEWNIKDIDERLLYHNTVSRVKHGYDVWAERQIYEAYLKRTASEETAEQLGQRLARAAKSVPRVKSSMRARRSLLDG